MADRIYVLKEGEVVPSRTHDEPMAAAGYSGLFGLLAAATRSSRALATLDVDRPGRRPPTELRPPAKVIEPSDW